MRLELVLESGQRLKQVIKVKQRSRRFVGSSPILSMSSLELELLLDQSLKSISEFYEQNPTQCPTQNPSSEAEDLAGNLAGKTAEGIASKTNYFKNDSFLNAIKSVKGKIQKEKYLEIPAILVKKTGNGYSAEYNPLLDKRIAEKLRKFKRVREKEEPSSLDQIFSKQFARDRKWAVDHQTSIVKYLCEMQDKYLGSGNPLDLQLINQQDAAAYIGHSVSAVCRLLKNLAVQLPDGKTIFAYELITGAKKTSIKGIYVLKELQKDTEYYENSAWKVSAWDLKSVLKERFGIKIARRTVSKYLSALD